MANNIRVSELALITAPEVAVNDLFLLADVSEIKSKKLSALELTAYMQSAITSSVSSSHSLTASYLLYQGFPNGTASYALLAKTSSYNLSSSHAIWADTASHALYAKSASYALTSSYAISSSYSATSSVQLTYSSAYADYARTASFLLYTGIPNGTASHAIYSLASTTAKTASYLSYTLGQSNGTSSNARTASYAISASRALSSSYLIYKGTPNGTASHALVADNATNATYATYTSQIMNWGIYNSTLNTPSASGISLSVLNSLPYTFETIVTATGNIKYNYTGSSATKVLTLIAIDNTTAASIFLDSSSFSTTANGIEDVSGSVNTSFVLMGQTTQLNGSYTFLVSGSSDINVNGNRGVKIKIESQGNNIFINP
jgi:hypothetical protein